VSDEYAFKATDEQMDRQSDGQRHSVKRRGLNAATKHTQIHRQRDGESVDHRVRHFTEGQGM